MLIPSGKGLGETGLAAGGSRIRTIGPALAKRLSAVAEGRCRTDKLDGVIKHRSSRATTMVGGRAALHGRLFLGGTDGSNPVPSGEESVHLLVAHRCGLLVQGRMARVPVCDRLERMASPQQQLFRQVPSYQLETDRRATFVSQSIGRCAKGQSASCQRA